MRPSQIIDTDDAIGAHLREQLRLRGWAPSYLASELEGYEDYDVSKWLNETRPLPTHAMYQIASLFSASPVRGSRRHFAAHVATLVTLTVQSFGLKSSRVSRVAA